MRKALVVFATLCLAASYPLQAAANTFAFNFNGPGVSGTIDLTYGAATDAKYPQAFEVTGINVIVRRPPVLTRTTQTR